MKKKTWCHGTGVNTPDNKETNLLNMLVILHPTNVSVCSLLYYVLVRVRLASNN